MTPMAPTASPLPGLRALLALALAALLGACGGGGGPEPGAGGPGPALGALAPDFALPDVNAASPSYTQLVGPVLRRGAASAWYFAHAT